MTAVNTIPSDLLASPTLGAWRQANDIDGTEWLRMLALTLAELALQRAVLERLDGISRFVYAGATTTQIVDRLAHLIDELDPGFAAELIAQHGEAA